MTIGSMVKSRLMSTRAMLVLPLATAAALMSAEPASAAGRMYYMDNYSANCQGGTDEGMIWVGSGKFSVSSTMYERTSALKNLGNGWVQAKYAASTEGMVDGEYVLKVKTEDSSVTIRSDEGEVHGTRCR
ncbi:hypothetical protein AYJ57_20735 (plasmid) [Salipiger sp. CCB-MM3]|uniref:hypothetical protein n=1 Tax=Salipiger sp. CCB-MM3 TaxID=1792508 RepID=UPI00080AB512|nr:hypothetical protein [Salipiger sp. CCB-MM3]ANT62909.1 hypothetical protein AYJ57_20735 [Salipiger sp. CCB-MM3]